MQNSGWRRDPPVRGAGYEPPDKDTHARPKHEVCFLLAEAVRGAKRSHPGSVRILHKRTIGFFNYDITSITYLTYEQ